MDTFFIKAAQLLLSLSILVVLHELGHFIPAKLFKTKVEKFYLFFNPWFSLFKFKKGETEYGIGWLPLGGYVKIAGMIDESMDKEQMKKPPEPWEFRSKPAWQRLIVMIGGVAVNVFLGFLIYTLVLFAWGEKYLPNQNLTDGIWCADSIAYNIGFQNGDKILAVNNEEVGRFDEVMAEILFGGNIQVDRNGEEVSLDIPKNFIEQLLENKKGPVLYPRVPFIIKEIPDSSINKSSGLKEKDKVIAIEGAPIKYYDEFVDQINNYKSQTVELTVERDKGSTAIVEVQVNENSKIIVQPGLYSYDEMRKAGLYEFNVKTYTFFEAVPAGINKAISRLEFYVRQFKLILNPSTGAYKGVGGFGAIGGLFPPEWEWEAFWNITAFLSLILAFMNLLPIPALDGGHVMFLLFEIITGKAPPEKFLERAQIIGMILLITLLVFANGNDIKKFFFD